MSGARAALSVSAEPRCQPQPEVMAMQDQLYEILATGIDPSPKTPLSAVESFLHEHARCAKSLEDFKAFFAEHELTATPTALPPPESGDFALPTPPMLQLVPDGAEVPREDPTVPRGIELVDPGDFAEPLTVQRGNRGLWFGLGVLGLLLIALGAGAYVVIEDLRGELRHAQEQGTRNEVVIDQLKGQAAGIESSVAANGELIQLVNDKSDLVLESLTQPEPKSRR